MPIKKLELIKHPKLKTISHSPLPPGTLIRVHICITSSSVLKPAKFLLSVFFLLAYSIQLKPHAAAAAAFAVWVGSTLTTRYSFPHDSRLHSSSTVRLLVNETTRLCLRLPRVKHFYPVALETTDSPQM